MERWAALAALPAVVPLAGLTLIPGSSAGWLLTAGALLAGPVRALGYDPLLDPACHACRSLPTVVSLSPAAVAALALVGGTLTLLGLALGLRGSTTPLLVAGTGGAGLWSLTGWSDVTGIVPESAAVAAVLAGYGAGLLLVRTVLTRTHLRRFATALASGTAPQDSLRRTLRDGSLTIDFAVAEDDWVDAAGRPSAGPALRQVTTQVRTGDDPVARVHHAPDSGRADALAASLTTELRLAIEHARLTAQLEAHVRLLRESRVRVVEAGDEARRRLERDLHDGAQQELLTLGFDLRRAHEVTPADASLPGCVAEVRGALEDLRTLASGVHPALLASAGLGPALELAGSRCQHAVRTTSMPAQRFAPAVERTAYLLVVDMADRGPVEVSGSVAGGALRMQVTGEPMSPTSVVPERVAALGGTLLVTSDRTDVVLPCG